MPDGVTVTISQMYALLQQVAGDVRAMKQVSDGYEDRLADHEARLRVVEVKITAALEAQRVSDEATRAKTPPTTIAALIVAAASVIVSILLYTIDR